MVGKKIAFYATLLVLATTVSASPLTNRANRDTEQIEPLSSSWQTCHATPTWPSTKGGEEAIIPCESGYSGNQTRYCYPTGDWAAPDQTRCIQLRCFVEGVWPVTYAGASTETPCPLGLYGNRQRRCSLEGHWGPIDDSDCTSEHCPSDGPWDASRIASMSEIPCPPGYDGSRKRYCNAYSQWEDADESECDHKTCAAQGEWPQTPIGTYADLPCEEGFEGTRRRFCPANQIWAPIDESACHTFHSNCPEEGDWPSTSSGWEAIISCPPGLSGSRKRQCRSNGEWEEGERNECASAICEEVDSWPTTIGGDTAETNCPLGFTGTRTRECSQNGDWGLIDETYCEPVLCPADGEWPEAYAGDDIRVRCPDGFDGERHRRCSFEGKWIEKNDTVCTQLVCGVDGVWPTTNASSVAMIPCPEGQTGNITRICSRSGLWGDVNNRQCRAVKCEAGRHWNAEEELCQLCLPGTFSNVSLGVNDTCSQCELGTYQSREGAKRCLPCPINSYADEKGLDKCKRCHNNQVAPLPGSSECVTKATPSFPSHLMATFTMSCIVLNGEDMCDYLNNATATFWRFDNTGSAASAMELRWGVGSGQGYLRAISDIESGERFSTLQLGDEIVRSCVSGASMPAAILDTFQSNSDWHFQGVREVEGDVMDVWRSKTSEDATLFWFMDAHFSSLEAFEVLHHQDESVMRVKAQLTEIDTNAPDVISVITDELNSCRYPEPAPTPTPTPAPQPSPGPGPISDDSQVVVVEPTPTPLPEQPEEEAADDDSSGGVFFDPVFHGDDEASSDTQKNGEDHVEVPHDNLPEGWKRYCDAEGEWPVTSHGHTQQLPCAHNAEKFRTRYCRLDGQWRPEDDSDCKLDLANILGGDLAEKESQLFGGLDSSLLPAIVGGGVLVLLIIAFAGYKFAQKRKMSAISASRTASLMRAPGKGPIGGAKVSASWGAVEPKSVSAGVPSSEESGPSGGVELVVVSEQHTQPEQVTASTPAKEETVRSSASLAASTDRLSPEPEAPTAAPSDESIPASQDVTDAKPTHSHPSTDIASLVSPLNLSPREDRYAAALDARLKALQEKIDKSPRRVHNAEGRGTSPSRLSSTSPTRLPVGLTEGSSLSNVNIGSSMHPVFPGIKPDSAPDDKSSPRIIPSTSPYNRDGRKIVL